MSDKRPWAKIDTGYAMNPKWFQIERFLANQITSPDGKSHGNPHGTCHQLAISNALRSAKIAHLSSILYCAQNQTDGEFPVRAIKAIASITTDEEELALTALFEVGMWINRAGGMALVKDYLRHQSPASLTKKRSEAGKAGAAARWQEHGKSHQSANSKPIAKANAEEKRREEIYIDECFAAWWPHYPKKIGKADARKAFKAALKKTDLEALTNATRAYAQATAGTETKYIKGPGAWLRDERWNDEITPTTTPGTPSQAYRSATEIPDDW